MTTDRTARPLPGCPARAGQGTDVRAARFTFVVEDHPDLTEVFGFYQIPGQDPDDLVQAAGFEVPTRSPIARLARQVAASPRRTRALAAVLRANILCCPCTPADGECPAWMRSGSCTPSSTPPEPPSARTSQPWPARCGCSRRARRVPAAGGDRLPGRADRGSSTPPPGLSLPAERSRPVPDSTTRRKPWQSARRSHYPGRRWGP